LKLVDQLRSILEDTYSIFSKLVSISKNQKSIKGVQIQKMINIPKLTLF